MAIHSLAGTKQGSCPMLRRKSIIYQEDYLSYEEELF